MMLFASLLTLAIALVSYEVGVHLQEDAEGIIILALVMGIVFLLISLVLLPWYLKLPILLGLLISKWYLPASVIRQ